MMTMKGLCPAPPWRSDWMVAQSSSVAPVASHSAMSGGAFWMLSTKPSRVGTVSVRRKLRAYRAARIVVRLANTGS